MEYAPNNDDAYPAFYQGITEEWLASVGFRWHQMDRQPDKHWLIWCGGADGDRITSFEDIGVEVAPAWWKNRDGDDVGDVAKWHVWFRSDAGGRYHRFLHVRRVQYQDELVDLIEAVTGKAWDPGHHHYGSIYTPEQSERIRMDKERLDHRLRRAVPWSEVEKDETRGRALPEHMAEHPSATPPVTGGGE